MVNLSIKSMSGMEGEVTIPSLGALIGTFSKWQLTRREEYRRKTGEFTLRGVFSYINPLLWNEESFQKEITIRLGRQRAYRLEINDEAKVVLEGRALTIEGVTPWPLVDPQQQQET